MRLLSLFKNAFSFVAVGTLAALVHLLVFGLFKNDFMPEVANLMGFLVAFCFSFAGHRLLSFRDAKTSLQQSFQRFALVSLAGFASNQLLFIAFYRALQWSDWMALNLVLVIAALQTFVLSRWWAFKR